MYEPRTTVTLWSPRDLPTGLWFKISSKVAERRDAIIPPTAAGDDTSSETDGKELRRSVIVVEGAMGAIVQLLAELRTTMTHLVHGAPPAGGEEGSRDGLHAFTNAGVAAVPASIGLEVRFGRTGGARPIHEEPTTFVGGVSRESATGEARSDLRDLGMGVEQRTTFGETEF